ncbi:hypothetical protein DES53_103169 [Roseimicrobium gellanilyticum]|uniref:Uncharacterized protein n=1 Tax=Roseimicrobium gellanilyticum TaxID=748857 RepID=A0A366HRJ2_9BACT|nr:hypothetical protein DES53_103169 [Roseimicrobium gellanilyticum]
MYTLEQRGENRCSNQETDRSTGGFDKGTCGMAL